MNRQFLAVLWRELNARGVQHSRQHRPAVLREFRRLRDSPPVNRTDSATRQHHESACLMLAAFRVLQPEVTDRNQLLHALQTALCSPNSWAIRTATRLLLRFSRDPMATLVRYTNTQLPPRYGSGFTFINEGSERDRFTMRVTVCFYHKFFAAHEAPELTRLYCAWDKNWIGAISEARHGVAFERPTTLADGGDSCPFTFIRVQEVK